LFLPAKKSYAVTVTVSFSFSVVVAVTVTVNNWLGLIGVTISGEFDVDDGATFEVTAGGDGALSVGFCGLGSAFEEADDSGADCPVPVG
jgi:hypothetical protein